MKTKILITAVNSPPGRAVYNSLVRKKNLELFCIDSDLNSVFKFQKKKKFYISPRAKKKNNKSFINKLIKKKKIEILIPCIEPEVIFFSKNYNYFNKKVSILIPKYNVLKKIVNKFNLYELCKKLKIKSPKTIKIKFPLNKNINDLHFPAILKPIVGWGMNNVRIIKNYKDFKEYTKYLKGTFILQEFLGNYKKNIFAVGLLMDRNGKEKLNFVSKSILTKYKTGGPAVAGIEVNNKKILIISRKLVKNLPGLSGPLMIEFIKTHGSNNFYLIDVNPRMWGYSLLATFNGKNFSKAIVDIHLNKKITINNNISKKFMLLRDFVDLKIKN